MSTIDPIVIVSATRTPLGALLGVFSSVTAPQLGAVAIKAAVERAGIAPSDVDEVIFGNVLSAGIGQAPARQAMRAAGLLDATNATTINKMCGSGMKSIMFAHDMILAGTNNIMVAGGMESMSNAPHLLTKMRAGHKYGTAGEVLDHMALDGLEDAYERKTPMGVFAERTATQYQFSREAQDQFALTSLARGKQANEDGSFDFEIAPVTVNGRKGPEEVRRDESPYKAMPDKIPSLKPAFVKDGTITAANASSINDGAAAVVLMRASEAAKRGLKPLAKIVAHSTHAQLPAEFTLAPVAAISKVLSKAQWAAGDVDLWEINEAFAVVTMAAMKEHNLAHERVNIHGGACALGHPLGASGARIVTTLIGALKKTGGKKGVASLCIGGGEAVAIAIEMI